METNRLRRALADRSALLGALVTMPGWVVPRVLARAGYQMLIFDWQHEPFTEATMAESIASGLDAGCICLVRTAVGRQDQIGMVLDMGAHGVLVPMIRDAADARAAAEACRYPPRGTRSIGGNRQQLLHGREYFSQADDDVVCAVQIEHIDAVRNIDAILSVKGIDAVIPGPVDLTNSLGRAASYNVMRDTPPETTQGLEAVRQACARAGVTYIAPCESRAQAQACRAAGDRIVLSGSDISLLTRSARDQAKSILGIIESLENNESQANE